MTLKTFTILVASVALAACGRGSEETAKPAPAASTTAEAPHKEDPTQLKSMRACFVTFESRPEPSSRAPAGTL